jgi:hypothetical protein
MYGCSIDQRLMLPRARDTAVVVSTGLSLNACSLDRDPAADTGVRSSIRISHYFDRPVQVGQGGIAEMHLEGMASGAMEDGPDPVLDLKDMV